MSCRDIVVVLCGGVFEPFGATVVVESACTLHGYGPADSLVQWKLCTHSRIEMELDGFGFAGSLFIEGKV